MEGYYLYFILLTLFIIFVYIKRKRNTVAVWKLLHQRKLNKENIIMKELAKEFIDKECSIYLIASSEDMINGIIKEVTDGGIVIEASNGERQIINLDFISRIRELPKNKNGKKANIVWY